MSNKVAGYLEIAGLTTIAVASMAWISHSVWVPFVYTTGAVIFAIGRLAVPEYCHKGMKVAVTGKIRTGSYIDKNGVKSYSFDVAVDEIEFLGARPKDTESGGDDNIQQQEDTPEQTETMPVTDSSNEDMMR